MVQIVTLLVQSSDSVFYLTYVFCPLVVQSYIIRSNVTIIKSLLSILGRDFFVLTSSSKACIDYLFFPRYSYPESIIS